MSESLTVARGVDIERSHPAAYSRSMTRDTVRSLKRKFQASTRAQATRLDRLLGGESALALLDRSIRFGHGRLAVVRLAMAVDAGAKVHQEHWTYCAGVAQRGRDLQLHELYLSAVTRARSREDVGAPAIHPEHWISR
jgi:hypothetical protein